jgi:hypothetical protein
MASESVTIRPNSVEEIREAVLRWSHRRRSLSSRIHFSRPSRSEDRLIMRSALRQDVRLRFANQLLSCEFAGEKLDLDLGGFDVKAEVDGHLLIFEFKTSEAIARPLKEKLRVIERTKHPVFVSRALNALVDFEAELPAERIEDASTAPSDYMVLYEALTAPSVATHLASKDPLAAARLRGVDQQRAILEESGGVIGVDEVAELLGLSRQAVDKRRRRSQLIGLTRGRRGYVYPVWQFNGGKTLPHLEQVLSVLRDHDPWMQLSFFINPQDRLNGRTALEELRKGHVDSVISAARSYGEQGAS